MRHVAFPAIRAGEALNQVRHAKLVHPRNGAQLRAFRIDTVDAAFIIARAEVRPGLQLFRKIFGMLDDAAVDVGDVQRAVGAGLEHGGTKPVVARSEEFAVLFIGRAMAGERDTIGFQNFTMHNVLCRLADENAGGKIGAEQGIAIRRCAVRGSQIAGRVRPIESLLRPADGEDARGVRIVGQDPPRRGHREIGIAREIMLRQEVVPQPGRIFIAEPVPPIVAMTAELGLPFDQFKFSCVRLEPQIMPAEIGRLTGQHGSNGATAAAVGGIHPVVQAVFEAIDPMLLVAFIETDEERLAHICPAVGVGVLGVENLRRSADEHSFAPGHDSIGEIHILQKHGRLVEAPVAIGVFEIFDDASRFVAVDPGRGPG